MTTPASITVSLEWAKKLKKAGWPQEDNCHMWIKGTKWSVYPMHIYQSVAMSGPDDAFPIKDSVAAPTAEEILRRLPRALSVTGGYINPRIVMNDDGQEHFVVSYFGWEQQDDEDEFFHEIEKEADTLANAAAAMYCYLAEDKLL